MSREGHAQSHLEKATFGAGCFWGVEETFRQLKGVQSTAVGYAGGTSKNPTYEDVCTGTTGHAEAVQIQYDPSVIPYEELLKVFWNCHNPTTFNKQGPDIGEQYRSVIFFHTPEQEARARKSKSELEQSGKWKNPIVTEIIPAGTFYRAEEYHQQYLRKRGLGICH
jgi:peptide-methionine (S)-S-oxide reductase